MTRTAARLRGARLLVLNWRDVTHPLAGGAEQYMHEIGRRWVEEGAGVTWFTARAPGQAAREVLDGMHVLRAGGPLSLYARTAARLVRTRGHFDAVIDCQNGVPFFAPLFVGADVPVVQVVHHVHQDQFATRFPAPMAAVGRLLEGAVARRIYGDRATAAVSPSTKAELRKRLRFEGPIFVVPNGTSPVRMGNPDRSPEPTIVLVSRLVPHKRVDLLLGHLAAIADQIPGLRVDIVGDGPERSRLQGLAGDLGLRSVVRFHGRVPDAQRDQLIARAWLTTSTSAAEGWGCAVIEAAAWGVPCLALRVPGIRDSILDGETGWLVEQPSELGGALVAALTQLRDRGHAASLAAACRRWAACFSWERSADLLAGVLVDEMQRTTACASSAPRNRRSARSDMAVLARFATSEAVDVRGVLRCTDELVQDGGRTSVVLSGCDEADCAGVLERIGVPDGVVQLADRRLMLAGPGAPPVSEVGMRQASLGRSA